MFQSFHALSSIHPEDHPQSVFSFDLFDTLIYRRLLRFDQVHDLASAYALALMGRHGSERAVDLTSARYRATDALKAAPSMALDEPPLDLVWSRLVAARIGGGDAAEAMGRRIADFEYDVDRANLVAVDGAIELLSALKAAGKRVIAVSDMYFSGDEVRGILDGLGLLHFFERVFVSSDEGATKQTGRIFPKVCEALGIAPDEIVHFGDNMASDVERPRELGLAAHHVDQHATTQPEPQHFGARRDIHLEVADLVKLFIARIRFRALNDCTERLYFLSRDGCLVNRVSEMWRPPLVAQYFGDVPTEDMFMGRAVSCWLNLDFGGHWLLQAIGHAFWLRHGSATPKQISSLFGIEGVPPTLEDRPYTNRHDTFLVLAAYEEAGLAPAIRESLVAKRRQTMRYLEDIGFFRYRNVALCDIGYSGTVPRDLNTFFLQSAAEAPDRAIPRIVFHSIASNDNYARNAIAAQPHVEFPEKVILPTSEMPKSLSDSFAWLEMFFKHPTYGPLLGYREEDGRTVPDFQVADSEDPSHPAKRILAAAVERPSDLVLLWMAAVDRWEDFSEPLLKRFAFPDDATVDQMLADVYEVDAVSGETRSVVLVAPDLDDEAISAEAAARDYWIPGSLVASRRVRESRLAPQALDFSALARQGRPKPIIDFLRRVAAKKSGGGAFDPVFYRDYYADLRAVPTDAMLAEHYRQHGRILGRYGSQAEFTERVEADLGRLPADFEYGAYLLANRDLIPGDPARWQAELHYLRHGRAEGRSYRLDIPGLEDEFDGLVARGRVVLDDGERRAWEKGAPISKLLFERHLIGAGPWLADFNLAEFVALNFDWCGPLDNRAEALLAFLEHGLPRVAPLSLASIFDPAFYRTCVPGLAAFDDVAVYGHWLATGALRGIAPSEEARLIELVGTREFPVAFHGDRFLERHRRQLSRDPSRTDLLAAFLERGDPVRDDAVIEGEGAAALWEILARRAHLAGQLERALAACHRALAVGGAPGRLWHRIGDILLWDNRPKGALAAYLHAIAAPQPVRWSFINGVKAACTLGRFETARRILDAGEEPWKSSAPWREARAHFLQQWFDAEFPKSAELSRDTHAIVPAIGIEAKVVAFVQDYADVAARALPSQLSLASATGPVVLLSSRILSRATRSLQGGRTAPAGHADARLRVFSREEIHSFSENLVGASLAIFHETEIDSLVIDALLLARGYGIPVIFWAGPLGRTEAGELLPEPLDLSDLAFDAFAGQDLRSREDANPAVRLRWILAASLCDHCVTTAPALVPALKRLAPAARISIAMQAGSRTRIGGARPMRLLLSIAGRPPESDAVAEIARSLAIFMASHPQAELLIDGAKRLPRALVLASSRVTLLPVGIAPAQASALVAAVDIVVDLAAVSRNLFSWWAEAAGAERPAVVLAERACDLVDRHEAIVIDKPVGLAEALSELLADEGLRDAIGRAAGQRLRDRQALVAGRPAVSPGDTRKRILYANVFAPPQLIGGATRVLSDNLGTLIDVASDRYAASVLTSDDGNAAAGDTRCDAWRGVPIFRIATPQEVDMDWRTYNAQVDLYARRVLALADPDLVHIHCLPRLSVAVAEACRVAGKPYIVTLHDGWWLSDYPFLVDETGMPADVDPDAIAQPWSRRIGLPRSLERAGRMRSALQGASKLLAVSEAFANVYGQAGFEVETVANGVSDLALQPRRPGGPRVRLGHIGGLQHHKGGYLVEAVLRAHDFDNLELFIVDLAREMDETSHTMWGTTPVTILGKTPTDQVSTLYSGLDVLLAPSIWPESFGLVSREALLSGLWVVASDRGAVAGDVVPGENGFVIDVASPEGLAAALRAIDADPARFRSPPARTLPLRTATEQGIELIALYDRLLDG